MSRKRILVDTIARLERERFRPMSPECCNSGPPPISDAEAAEHARVLMEALGDDIYAADWRGQVG